MCARWEGGTSGGECVHAGRGGTSGGECVHAGRGELVVGSVCTLGGGSQWWSTQNGSGYLCVLSSMVNSTSANSKLDC